MDQSITTRIVLAKICDVCSEEGSMMTVLYVACLYLILCVGNQHACHLEESVCYF